MHEGAVDKTSSAQARNDLLAMFRQMTPSLGVLVLVYVLATMAWLAASAPIATWMGAYILRMLMFMGLAFAAAPFTRALYRFVAHGEVTWLPTLGRFDDNTRIFATYASLMTALYFVPPIGRELVVTLGWVAYADATWFILCLAVWLIIIRSTTLLPMAALDPQRASWTHALAQSRGQTIRYFFATTVPAAPAFIAMLVLVMLVVRGAMHAFVFFPVVVVLLLAIQLLPLSAATRIYLDERRREREG